VPAYRRSGKADVVAVFDRKPERARELASYARGTAYSGELNAMLSKEHLDVVSVCTPPWLHAPQAILALESGANVLVEKPMAMTEADCRAMGEAAARHGKTLGVCHNFLFSRAVSEVSRRVESGRAGHVESVLGFQMSTPRRRLPEWYDSLPGQLFFDEAPHLTYLSRHFLGPEEPRLVHASALQGDLSEVQRTQNVVSVLEGRSGMGILTMNFNASRAEWALGVVGSKESYVVDLFRDQLVVLGRGGAHTPGEVFRQTVGGLARMTAGAIASGSLYAMGRLLYGHRELVDAFVTAVLKGRPAPVSAEDGMHTIALLEAICREARLEPFIGAGSRAHARPASAIR
jgi:predicted dehydrogenase